MHRVCFMWGPGAKYGVEQFDFIWVKLHLFVNTIVLVLQNHSCGAHCHLRNFWVARAATFILWTSWCSKIVPAEPGVCVQSRLKCVGCLHVPWHVIVMCNLACVVWISLSFCRQHFKNPSQLTSCQWIVAPSPGSSVCGCEPDNRWAWVSRLICGGGFIYLCCTLVQWCQLTDCAFHF
jgi:hypothetical protein